jgi:hypothetical protein
VPSAHIVVPSGQVSPLQVLKAIPQCACAHDRHAGAFTSLMHSFRQFCETQSKSCA